MRTRHLALFLLAAAACSDDMMATTPDGSSANADARPAADAATQSGKKVVIFVWDGLRPDSVNTADTPNLVQLGLDASPSRTTTRRTRRSP
jgi:hypothetical protein